MDKHKDELDFNYDDLYFKILSDSLWMKCFQYKLGLNIDTREFDLGKGCCTYGLHFCSAEHVMNFTDYGDKMAVIKIPAGSKIRSGDQKYRTDKLEILEVFDYHSKEGFKRFLELAKTHMFEFSNMTTRIFTEHFLDDVETYNEYKTLFFKNPNRHGRDINNIIVEWFIEKLRYKEVKDANGDLHSQARTKDDKIQFPSVIKEILKTPFSINYISVTQNIMCCQVDDFLQFIELIPELPGIFWYFILYFTSYYFNEKDERLPEYIEILQNKFDIPADHFGLDHNFDQLNDKVNNLAQLTIGEIKCLLSGVGQDFLANYTKHPRTYITNYSKRFKSIRKWLTRFNFEKAFSNFVAFDPKTLTSSDKTIDTYFKAKPLENINFHNLSLDISMANPEKIFSMFEDIGYLKRKISGGYIFYKNDDDPSDFFTAIFRAHVGSYIELRLESLYHIVVLSLFPKEFLS